MQRWGAALRAAETPAVEVDAAERALARATRAARETPAVAVEAAASALARAARAARAAREAPAVAGSVLVSGAVAARAALQMRGSPHLTMAAGLVGVAAGAGGQIGHAAGAGLRKRHPRLWRGSTSRVTSILSDRCIA